MNMVSCIISAASCKAQRRTIREARCTTILQLVNLLLRGHAIETHHSLSLSLSLSLSVSLSLSHAHFFVTDPMLKAMYGPLAEVSHILLV